MINKNNWKDSINTINIFPRCLLLKSTISIIRTVQECLWSIFRKYIRNGRIGGGIWYIKNLKYFMISHLLAPEVHQEMIRIKVSPELLIFYSKFRIIILFLKSIISGRRLRKRENRKKVKKIVLPRTFYHWIMS